MTEREGPVLVVGAGPAGLAASARLHELGVPALLLEQGPGLDERGRDDADTVAFGLGGAGLYSDGKFSYYPAASGLWSLPERPALARAWQRLGAALVGAGLAPPPSLRLPEGDRFEPAREGWSHKPYPAVYGALEARRALIAQLAAPSERAAALLLRTPLRSLERAPAGALRASFGPAGAAPVPVAAAVLAAGRFAPWTLAAPLAGLALPQRFVRVELGVRLEGPSDHPFFAQLAGVDPKWLLRGEGGRSYRTFCLCRDGELVSVRCGALRCASGRADGARTGRSNVGFLARFERPCDEAAEALAWLRDGPAPARCSLPAALDERSPALAALVGPAAGALRVGLRSLAERFEALREAPTALALHGPCVEGLGAYPDTTLALEVAPRVYVAGDGAGRFRGLVAALASGFYVAELLAARLAR